MEVYTAAAVDIRDWSSGCETGHQSYLLQILQQKDKNKKILKEKLLGEKFKRPNIQIHDTAEGKHRWREAISKNNP